MKTSTWIGILIAIAAGAAHAQEGATRGILTGGGGPQWTGLAPFVGLGAGYTDSTEILEPEGIPTSAKLLGSFITPTARGVFDAGLGFHNQTFTADDTDENVQSTILEAAARYQWDNRWQAGAVWNTLFNQGESYGANQADVQMVGLQALREFQIADSWTMRAGGRYMTDLNIDGTVLNQVMVDLAFGWNARPAFQTVGSRAYQRDFDRRMAMHEQGDSVVRVNRARDLQEASPAAESLDTRTPGRTVATGTVLPEATADGDYQARPDLLLFDTGSSELSEGGREKLEQLAAALQEDEEIVERIELIGYTDPTGRPRENLKLSEQRAHAVKQQLVEAGIPEDRITVIAKGHAGPRMESNEKSRRVEMRFINVKNQEKLDEIVSSIE